MIIVSLVTMSPEKTVCDCIFCNVHLIPVTHLFCNWKFKDLHLLHLFLFSPHSPSPLAMVCSFSISITLLLFCCIYSFVLILDSICK